MSGNINSSTKQHHPCKKINGDEACRKNQCPTQDPKPSSPKTNKKPFKEPKAERAK
jgi:hypothetical protein